MEICLLLDDHQKLEVTLQRFYRLWMFDDAKMERDRVIFSGKLLIIIKRVMNMLDLQDCYLCFLILYKTLMECMQSQWHVFVCV